MFFLHKFIRKYNKLLIVFILGLSFLLSRMFIGGVFYANTPRLNPLFIQNLKNAPKTIASIPSLLFSKKQDSHFNYQGSVVSSAPVGISSQVPFKKISKGVYAGEKAGVQYAMFSESEIDWKEIRLKTKRGKEVVLRYPKDVPPLKEVLDIIQSE